MSYQNAVVRTVAKQQQSTSLSSCEAELYAIQAAAQDSVGMAKFLHRFLFGLGEIDEMQLLIFGLRVTRWVLYSCCMELICLDEADTLKSVCCGWSRRLRMEPYVWNIDMESRTARTYSRSVLAPVIFCATVQLSDSKVQTSRFHRLCWLVKKAWCVQSLMKGLLTLLLLRCVVTRIRAWEGFVKIVVCLMSVSLTTWSRNVFWSCFLKGWCNFVVIGFWVHVHVSTPCKTGSPLKRLNDNTLNESEQVEWSKIMTCTPGICWKEIHAVLNFQLITLFGKDLKLVRFWRKPDYPILVKFFYVKPVSKDMMV